MVAMYGGPERDVQWSFRQYHSIEALSFHLQESHSERRSHFDIAALQQMLLGFENLVLAYLPFQCFFDLFCRSIANSRNGC